MELPKRRIQKFQQFIFLWWQKHKRNLPWRHTHDPYKILISEVMLQQTQVQRVIPKYSEFIRTYPTASSLAAATPADILRLWKGMGYNRRALYLHKTAKIIVGEYGGKFPKMEKFLTQLPGLGMYTARAILVFAYKQEVAVVDTNVRRIIVHFFFDGVAQKESVIQSVADQLVPKGKSWEWHQALMDYGAIELSKFNRPERSRRTAIPFKNSNRYFRGRIIDMLREKDMNEAKLVKECVSMFDRSDDFVGSVLEGLEKDGLISRKHGTVSLPQ